MPINPRSPSESTVKMNQRLGQKRPIFNNTHIPVMNGHQHTFHPAARLSPLDRRDWRRVTDSAKPLGSAVRLMRDSSDSINIGGSMDRRCSPLH